MSVGFLSVWEEFQRRVHDLVINIAKDVEPILWTSTLTNAANLHRLPKEYTIQIWTNASVLAQEADKTQLVELIKSDHKMIFSNTDALYLDCGYGSWVGKGNTWCSPYHGWQAIYDNDLYQIALDHGAEAVTDDIKERILGAEIALWSETVSTTDWKMEFDLRLSYADHDQVSPYSFESKIFPRASALAERLWTNPATRFDLAETRMVQMTHRLTQRGIKADAIKVKKIITSF